LIGLIGSAPIGVPEFPAGEAVAGALRRAGIEPDRAEQPGAIKSAIPSADIQEAGEIMEMLISRCSRGRAFCPPRCLLAECTRMRDVS
jgi:hypothetical protein